MVASINNKSTMIPVFFFIINLKLKQKVSKTESNWRFQKNLKTCLQDKKSYLMSPSRYGHFHPVVILPVKMVKILQEHADTTVHWL